MTNWIISRDINHWNITRRNTSFLEGKQTHYLLIAGELRYRGTPVHLRVNCHKYPNFNIHYRISTPDISVDHMRNLKVTSSRKGRFWCVFIPDLVCAQWCPEMFPPFPWIFDSSSSTWNKQCQKCLNPKFPHIPTQWRRRKNSCF